MENIKKIKCEICNRNFTRKYNLRTHIKTKHEHISLDYSCYLCRKNFKNQDKYLKHIGNHKEGISFVLYKHAFQKSLQIFRKHFKNYFSLTDILNETNDIQKLLEGQLLHYPKYKCTFLVQVEYILKGNDNSTMEKEIFNIRSSNFIISRIFSKKRMKKLISTHLFEILDKEKDMNLLQSGWTLNKVILIDINLFKVNLLL